jgi:hypothetical protein
VPGGEPASLNGLRPKVRALAMIPAVGAGEHGPVIAALVADRMLHGPALSSFCCIEQVFRGCAVRLATPCIAAG